MTVARRVKRRPQHINSPLALVSKLPAVGPVPQLPIAAGKPYSTKKDADIVAAVAQTSLEWGQTFCGAELRYYVTLYTRYDNSKGEVFCVVVSLVYLYAYGISYIWLLYVFGARFTNSVDVMALTHIEQYSVMYTIQYECDCRHAAAIILYISACSGVAARYFCCSCCWKGNAMRERKAVKAVKAVW